MRYYKFSNLVGNNDTISLLQRNLVNGTLPNFCIFSGTMGTGKSTCAEIASLYLTCEHPVHGEPCLECDSCRNNLEALKTTGKSSRIFKINLGRYNSKSDVEKMIHEIFVLEAYPGKNTVYILEEAHALPQYLQTALLEEIDRIQNNTYVIICTTKISSLLPELVSRGIQFNYNRLNNSSMRILLDRYTKSLGKTVDDGTARLLLGSARGIPRNLVNLVDFIINSRASVSEIQGFLGYVSDTTYIELFRTLLHGGMNDIVVYLDDLVGSNDIPKLVRQMKDFVLRVIFYLEGGVDDTSWTPDDKSDIRSIFKDTNLLKLGSYVEKQKTNMSDTELKLSLINLKSIIINQNVGSVIGDKTSSILRQRKEAARLNVERNKVENSNDHTDNVMTLDQFSGYGGGRHSS